MNTIQELLPQIKGYVVEFLDDWGTVAIVALVGSVAFGLGRFSALQSPSLPIVVQAAPQRAVGESPGSAQAAAAASALSAPEAGGAIVASKNGSSYHLPWCSGAKSISDKNKIYFANEEEAKAAGYKPAKNCKGLGGN